MKTKINAKGMDIAIISKGNMDDYISLTDIAKYKNKEDAFIVINNWMRLSDTIEFLGLWESLSNPNFKPIEFDRFRQESGYNAFTLSPQKWIKPPMLLESSQNQEDMAEPMHTKISPLNLHLGFQQNSNSTLLKIINGSKKMKTAKYLSNGM